MSTHAFIAFLRAINVGGHLVKMDQLRALFTALGFADVATFIASGNVIFGAAHSDAATLEADIERHLLRSLGYDVETFLRTFAEIAAIAAYSPFPGVDWKAEGAGLYVGFLRAAPSPQARSKLLALSNDIDELHVHGRELYWLGRKKFGQATVTGAQLEKVLGMRMTLRNVNTVSRLTARYPAS